MTSIKTLLVAAMLTAFTAGSFAQTPAPDAGASAPKAAKAKKAKKASSKKAAKGDMAASAAK